MKSEKELISQIRILKEIKPDTDWVSLTKMQIMGTAEIGHKQSLFNVVSSFVLRYKIAIAGILLVGIAGGSLMAAQNALPGDALYSLKLVSEKGFAVITGQDKNPAANLHLAAKRLEEINLMSQRDFAKNLSMAFYEYKTAKAAAKKEVATLVKLNPSKAGEIVKEAGVAMRKINI
jgi:hypothetical protein